MTRSIAFVFTLFIVLSCDMEKSSQTHAVNDQNKADSTAAINENTANEDSLLTPEIKQLQSRYPSFDCYDGSQAEMNMCSYNEYRYYNSLLTVRFKETTDQIKTDMESYKDMLTESEVEIYEQQISSLERSQEAWLKFREENASVLSYQYYGGSIEPLMVNTQRIRDTKERLMFLDDLLEE